MSLRERLRDESNVNHIGRGASGGEKLGEPSEITAVHLDIYSDHLRQKDSKLESREVRALVITGGPRLMKVNGHYIEVYGPHPIRMNVDGIKIYTKAHVTVAKVQVGQIYIGGEELKVLQIGHKPCLNKTQSHRL